MKPTNLCYIVHAPVIGVNGKAGDRVAVTLPFVSILRLGLDGKPPPKPRKLDTRPALRKRLTPPSHKNGKPSPYRKFPDGTFA